eukprot:1551436-Amphidinium_carterae.1
MQHWFKHNVAQVQCSCDMAHMITMQKGLCPGTITIPALYPQFGLEFDMVAELVLTMREMTAEQETEENNEIENEIEDNRDIDETVNEKEDNKDKMYNREN